MRGHRLILPHDTVQKEARLRVIMSAIGIGLAALLVAIAQIKVSLTGATALKTQVQGARSELQDNQSAEAVKMRENAAATAAILQKLVDDAKKAQEAPAVDATAAPTTPDTTTPQPPNTPTPTEPPAPAPTKPSTLTPAALAN